MLKIKYIPVFIASNLAFFALVTFSFPQILFAHKIEYKCFTVYYHSNTTNAEALYAVLDKSEQLLKTSALFDASHNQKLFLCSGFPEFAFFAPLSRKAFAVNYLLTQHIFLAKSSVSANRSTRNGNENNERTLSSVIAHETVHSLLENKLGLLKYKLLPKWKDEGYSDFIANESSYDIQKGLINICSSKKPSSASFNYFKYRLYIKYLLEEEQLTLDQVLNNEFDLAVMEEKLKDKYCVN